MTISIPNLSRTADVFILEWEKEKLKIVIDRLHEKSDGISGEVLVSSSTGHLYHGRLNLLATRSKTELVNALKKRINTIDWQAIIEQASIKVLTEFRKGEQVIKVGNLPIRERQRYRLYPFILESERTILFGYGGTGKSKLSQFMGLLVQCGIPLLGMRPIKGNVLLLDWETSQYTVDEWIKAIKSGMGIESNEMPLYRYCTRGLADDIVEIQRIVLEHHIELVIVDSVGIAIGGDAESQDMTRTYFNALRSLKIASLSIDHKPKKGNTIYGSVYKTNIARSTFEIRGKQSPGSSSLDIGIYHRKANDTSLIKPIGFHLEFLGDEEHTESVSIRIQEITDIPELEEGLSNRQRIINILKKGALNPKDIAEQIDTTEHVVRTTLNRFKGRVFTKNATGEWGLLSSYEE